MNKIIGCTVDGEYESCVDCACRFSPVGCVTYRNKYSAEVIRDEIQN